ncbi:uncharacterized protein LOC107433612 [Ziziphus jujuba]|uniref:Uncharacterized protein LOC107432249 n=1 Tax=Ziziphus jujuba TaxID=326968 RepID=A0A6P4BCN0_ZIZJJ|nr:uncharacterized protein LOC107433612 [Ziziphus jujuba]
MAEFPPNPDDGELWLPSDIFLNEMPSRLGPHRFPCMDDLAQQFAALALFKQRRSLSKLQPKVSPNAQRFRPPVQYGQGNPLSHGRSSLRPLRNGGLEDRRGVNGFETEPYLGGSELFYGYQLLKPTKPQVDSFLQARATVFQRQQNRIQNRLLPNKGSGPGIGGFVKVSGGTGVFHPRVSNTTIPTIDVKKKQGLRNRQGIQMTSQGSFVKRVGGHKDEFQYQLPPEMGLPQDWTY